jgi:hypothetical protein
VEEGFNVQYLSFYNLNSTFLGLHCSQNMVSFITCEFRLFRCKHIKPDFGLLIQFVSQYTEQIYPLCHTTCLNPEHSGIAHTLIYLFISLTLNFWERFILKNISVSDYISEITFFLFVAFSHSQQNHLNLRHFLCEVSNFGLSFYQYLLKWKEFGKIKSIWVYIYKTY